MTIKSGYYSDNGEEIDPLTVPIPALCNSCLKKNDAKEETQCLLNRMDQIEAMNNGEIFLCFAYEPNDPSIDKKKVYKDTEGYWAKQNRKYSAQKKRRKKFRYSFMFDIVLILNSSKQKNIVIFSFTNLIVLYTCIRESSSWC